MSESPEQVASAAARGVPTVCIAPVGRAVDGTPILEISLQSSRGTRAALLSLGATLRSLVTPDARGALDDIVLGFDRPEDYLAGRHYFGATVGRYANRIARGHLRIGDRDYGLALNDPPNAEHGGEEGFSRRPWQLVRTAEQPATCSATLALLSPDGDQGYPGELAVEVTYSLSDAEELRIDYRAVSDADTVINLTHHSYWNLAGAGGGSALGAQLRIEADEFTPVGPDLIPTGELRAVEGTAFDFRRPRALAESIRDGSDPQLRFGRGYDHNFALRGPAGMLRTVATLHEPRSGRILEIATTEPGLQLYTGNFLDGTVLGKGRRLYRQGDGIALETQHFPDSPHQPHFPTTLIERGHVWRSSTIYRFRTAGDDVPTSHCDMVSSDQCKSGQETREIIGWPSGEPRT